MEENTNQKRINFDIPQDLHAEIKRICAIKRLTIRKYVLRSILKSINEDKKRIK